MTKKYVSISNALEIAKTFHEQLEITDPKRYPEKVLAEYHTYKQLLAKEETNEDWKKVYSTLFGREDEAVNTGQAFTLMIGHCAYAHFYLGLEVKNWFTTLFKMRCSQHKTDANGERIAYPEESIFWKNLVECYPDLLTDQSSKEVIFSIDYVLATVCDFLDFFVENYAQKISSETLDDLRTCKGFLNNQEDESDIILRIQYVFFDNLESDFKEQCEFLGSFKYLCRMSSYPVFTEQEIFSYTICAFGYYAYYYGYEVREFFELLLKMIYYPNDYKDELSTWDKCILIPPPIGEFND